MLLLVDDFKIPWQMMFEEMISVQLYIMHALLCYKTIAVGKDLRISTGNAKYLLATVGYILSCT